MVLVVESVVALGDEVRGEEYSKSRMKRA